MICARPGGLALTSGICEHFLEIRAIAKQAEVCVAADDRVIFVSTGHCEPEEGDGLGRVRLAVGAASRDAIAQMQAMLYRASAAIPSVAPESCTA